MDAGVAFGKDDRAGTGRDQSKRIRNGQDRMIGRAFGVSMGRILRRADDAVTKIPIPLLNRIVTAIQAGAFEQDSQWREAIGNIRSKFSQRIGHGYS